MSADEESDLSFVSNETTIHYHSTADLQDSSLEHENLQSNGSASPSVLDAQNDHITTLNTSSSSSPSSDDFSKSGQVQTRSQIQKSAPAPPPPAMSPPPSHSARGSPEQSLVSAGTPSLYPYSHKKHLSQGSINGMLLSSQSPPAPSKSPGFRPPSSQSYNRPAVRTRTSLKPMSSRSSLSSFDYGLGNNPSSSDFNHGYSPAPNSGPAPPNPNHSRKTSMASLTLNEAATQHASASMFDLSQSYLTPHFADEMKGSLLPRIQTIELYRKNAKKSNDPVIQFQFAQYMLQTALLSGTSAPKSPSVSGIDRSTATVDSMSLSSVSSSAPPSRTASPHKKNQLQNLLPGADNVSEHEKKIKADLLKEAISNLRKLSDKGYADAQYLLGDAYASGALGKPDLKESFNLFQLAAKHGHGEASYRAALCLEEGWGTSRDMRRAVQFLRTAASRNQPGAMLRLGLACFYGKMGLGQSTKIKQEGIKWLSRSTEVANEVYPQAPYELAKIYETGYKDIVFTDFQYAVQLYVKSAELNYIPAATVVGHAYEYGKLGCPQDAALSIHYYTIAALGGDPKAMLAMCAWYMVGAEPVLPRNEEEAYEWAIRAAQRGLPKAQFAVGYFLENGIGVERDILQSTNWYRMAAEGGDSRAVDRLSRSRQAAMSSDSKKKGDKDCIIM